MRYSEISRFTHNLISASADSYDTVIILLFDILPCRTGVIYSDLGFTELKKMCRDFIYLLAVKKK